MFHEFDELAKSMDEVIKAGEGSHGGKVIGHTSSGKPIYASKMQHIDSGVHSSYSAKDHKEAVAAHANNPAMQKFHENWQKIKGNPLNKSLSHNPYQPFEMTSDSGFYNPYKMVDGAFLPHSTAYWRDQGKLEFVDGYEQTNIFYEKYFNASNAMKSFAETVGEDLIKGGAVPIGTVHTYKNGDKFKKVAEGKWNPIGETNSTNVDHNQTEKDASHLANIKEAIKKKYQEEGSNQKATVATHKELTEFAHAMWGDELPEKVKAHLEKKAKEFEKPALPQPLVQPVKEIQRHFSKMHTVDVGFKLNGQTYTHTFKDVQGASHDAVQAHIQELIKKKLPGAIITRMHTATNKPEKQKEQTGDKNESTQQARN